MGFWKEMKDNWGGNRNDLEMNIMVVERRTGNDISVKVLIVLEVLVVGKIPAGFLPTADGLARFNFVFSSLFP